MLRRAIFICLVLCVVGRVFGLDKPNMLIVLTDDQGWPTVGCYGGNIVPTPNLDRLAAEGIRFTDAYVTPQCTPTRATLLSGQYTARTGMWHVVGWYGCPWAPMSERPFTEQYPRSALTIASELKQAGYVTGIMGKWHVTTGRDGNYQGLNPEYAHYYGFDDAAPLLARSEFQADADRGVETLTRQALEFISDNRRQPWFCYLSHHMIHGNVVAPPELVQKYRDRGYGETGPNRAVYLAGLECIDRSMGTLMSQLQALGEADETIVIFMSDNGGIDTRLAHRSLPRPHPATPQFQPDLQEYDNAPLRAGKGSIYEGGVRVPLIIRWPGQAAAGSVCQQPVHVVDLAPTLLSIAGRIPPTDYCFDGLDLTALLRSGADDRLSSRPIYQYCPFYDLNWGLTPCASVRQGDYKLIEFFGDRFGGDGQYVPGHCVELYNLRTDLSEARDLASEMPVRRNQLMRMLHNWMGELGVAPTTVNQHYEPGRAFETTNQKPDWLESRQSAGPRMP